jgi:hypothetical protein
MRDTGGNPLVVAVARELRENRYNPLTAPESIRRDVARRIGRLTATSRNLAKVASVIGDDATLYDAARLGGLLPDQALPAVDELVKAGILTPDERVRFVHLLVRRAIYSLLAPAERLYLHGASAELLARKKSAPELIADHLLESGPTHEGWASAVLHEAGLAASRTGATAAAVRYLRRAADIGYAVEPSARVLIDLDSRKQRRASRCRWTVSKMRSSSPTRRACGCHLFTWPDAVRLGRYANASAAFRRGTALFVGGDQQVRMRLRALPGPPSFTLRPHCRSP